MPYLRPRNNIILPKEVHEGILWKEEKAIRKAQLASLLENQKSKRKYLKSNITTSSVELNLNTSQSIPSSSRYYAKYVKLKGLRKGTTKLKSTRKNNLFLSHSSSSTSHRSIVRYSLSPEYLASHKFTQNQISHSPSEKLTDTFGIVDEENLTPTKKKMYLAQRKFAQNDHKNTMVHDASLSNPLHASPNLMEVLADRPGVIQNGRTILIIRENSGQNLDQHEACGSGLTSSVIRRAPANTPMPPRVNFIQKRKSKQVDSSPKNSAARLKLRPAVNGGCKEENGQGAPIDTLDTTDFLSWLYMRHLPEMPPHLKDVDNYMKTFLAQKVPNV